jgi:hypothetical protein
MLDPKMLLGIVVFAVLVEAVVENIKWLIEGGWDKDRIVAIVMGMVLAFSFSVDVFHVLGYESFIPYLPQIVTGIIISRGANFVHDIYKAIVDFIKSIAGGG